MKKFDTDTHACKWQESDKSPLTAEDIEDMASEIRELFLKNGMWIDTTIYFNGKAFSTGDLKGNFYYNDPEHLVVLENEDPKLYTEYVGEILTMTFEGPFYAAINYNVCPSVLAEFNKIIGKRGCYYELGNSWDLTLFQI